MRSQKPRTRLLHRAALAAVIALVLVVALAAPAVAEEIIRLNGDVTVAADERYDSVVVMNGDVRVEGRVDGDVFAANGEITVANGGFVGGNAVSLTGQVVTEGSAVVAGDRVEGEWNLDWGDVPNIGFDPVPGFGGLGWIFLTLGAVGMGLLLVLISAPTLQSVGRETTDHLGRSALIGVLSLVGVPIVFVVLLISIIGIPLALLMIPLVPLVGLYGLYAVSMVAGQRLLRLVGQPKASDLWAMVAGVVLVNLILLIPVLGWLLFFIAGLVGFGAALSRMWGYTRSRRAAQPVPPPQATPPGGYPGYPGYPGPVAPVYGGPSAPPAPYSTAPAQASQAPYYAQPYAPTQSYSATPGYAAGYEQQYGAAPPYYPPEGSPAPYAQTTYGQGTYDAQPQYELTGYTQPPYEQQGATEQQSALGQRAQVTPTEPEIAETVPTTEAQETAQAPTAEPEVAVPAEAGPDEGDEEPPSQEPRFHI